MRRADPSLRAHAWPAPAIVLPRVLFVALLAVPFVWCSRTGGPDEVDGWALARAALTNGEHCFAQKTEYCLTDPELVDAAIRPRLDDLYGGKMPPRKVHVDAVIRAAAIAYKKQTQRPENLAKVEELVKERYHNPKVTLGDDVVSVDMGVVPGKIEPNLRLSSSDVIDRHEWSRAEIERVLSMFADKYPEKRVIRVAVTVPGPRGLLTMVYRYLRDENRVIIVGEGGEIRTTKRLSGDKPFAAPSVSLRFWELSECRESRMVSPADQDPPKTCPPDVDPAAPSLGALPP